MIKTRKLVIIGDSVFPQIAYEYFTHDSEYEVVAFSVEQEYLKRKTMFDLPIVAFESLTESYAPTEHDIFAAVVFREQNQLRARLLQQAKEKGYKAAYYISSRAFVSANAKIGEHCFICEATVIQQFAEIGDNVVLWSGNQIGQYAVVKSNCFTLPNAVISNRAEVGENCIIGANVTLADKVKVAGDKTIEIGALISEDVK
jgi:sugar O-acyltransferase (sialic acid O-acetyltransferase NeuD family)